MDLSQIPIMPERPSAKEAELRELVRAIHAETMSVARGDNRPAYEPQAANSYATCSSVDIREAIALAESILATLETCSAECERIMKR